MIYFNKNKLILVRHGESLWNKENRFTGWIDIDLSNQGYLESKKAGHILKKYGFFFDYGYTSVLKRAIHTLWNILDELNQVWLPVEKSWHLNERHYGILQGLNKSDAIKKYGHEQVKKWRRGFTDMPPPVSYDIGFFQKNNYCPYKYLDITKIPNTESLALTTDRILPYWKSKIIPNLKNKKKIIIVTHGNVIRAIIKILDNLDEKEISEINIPTGIPIVYEFENIKPIKYYFLFS